MPSLGASSRLALWILRTGVAGHEPHTMNSSSRGASSFACTVASSSELGSLPRKALKEFEEDSEINHAGLDAVECVLNTLLQAHILSQGPTRKRPDPKSVDGVPSGHSGLPSAPHQRQEGPREDPLAGLLAD